MNTSVALPALLTSLTLLAACVSPSVLHNEKQAEPVITVERLLVAGRTPDQHIRQQWEQHCVNSLGNFALPSTQTDAAEASFPNDKSAILSAAQHAGIQTILFAEISPLKLYASQQPAASESQSERLRENSGTLNITLRGEKQGIPDLPEQYIEFTLVNLQQKVLWSSIVQTHEANAIKAIAQSQCKSIRKSWQAGGLLETR